MIKILLLGAGLAMGLVLIAKIYFERTYDDFVPHIDRTYKVISLYGEDKNENGWISGAIVLLITLLGLVGYARDEANRRRKEIAIRKINGAPISVLMGLFLGNIMKLAIPSVVVGCVAGYLVADHWLAKFANKVDNSVWLYALCALVVVVLLAAVVLSVTYKAANTNPVKNLKSE